jgi:hypothetical protein
MTSSRIKCTRPRRCILGHALFMVMLRSHRRRVLSRSTAPSPYDTPMLTFRLQVGRQLSAISYIFVARLGVRPLRLIATRRRLF